MTAQRVPKEDDRLVFLTEANIEPLRRLEYRPREKAVASPRSPVLFYSYKCLLILYGKSRRVWFGLNTWQKNLEQACERLRCRPDRFLARKR